MSSTVLVTGWTGHIGSHVALYYLKQGWNVHATGRSLQKLEDFRRLPTFAPFLDRIELFEIQDPFKGDYSVALQGVEVVCNCASKNAMEFTSWAEAKESHVDLVAHLLEEAAKVPSVKSVVAASTATSISKNPMAPMDTLSGLSRDEDTWFEPDLATAEAINLETNPMGWFYWYACAKVLLERLEPPAGSAIAYSTVLLTACLGPILNLSNVDQVPSAGFSALWQWQCLHVKKADKPPMTFSTSWVDSRDVAQAMYLAGTKHAKGRYALCAGDFDFGIYCQRARALRPDMDATIPWVEADAETPLAKGSYTTSSKKAIDQLGWKPITLDESIKGAIESFEAIGAGVKA